MGASQAGTMVDGGLARIEETRGAACAICGFVCKAWLTWEH